MILKMSDLEFEGSETELVFYCPSYSILVLNGPRMVH
nr:hypothetical protein CJLB15_00100 [Campylobacter phage CJLB-15]